MFLGVASGFWVLVEAFWFWCAGSSLLVFGLVQVFCFWGWFFMMVKSSCFGVLVEVFWFQGATSGFGVMVKVSRLRGIDSGFGVMVKVFWFWGDGPCLLVLGCCFWVWGVGSSRLGFGCCCRSPSLGGRPPPSFGGVLRSSSSFSPKLFKLIFFVREYSLSQTGLRVASVAFGYVENRKP